jgi:sialic acid synthase SpsE
MEIIAEIGQNHNGDLNLAFELIHAAKENGADVAKFQLYDAKKLFTKKNNQWYEYNCRTEIKHQNLCGLVEECQKVDIEFMASVFDIERVHWLEEAGVKRYKVASRSIHDIKLLEAIISTGKTIIVSLGMWNRHCLPKIKTSAPVHFLHCISKYPTALHDLKLKQVDFEKKYAGISDHTIGIAAGLAAFSRGARILEKHFTLDKDMYGPDHPGSMTPDELKTLSDFRHQISQCL